MINHDKQSAVRNQSQLLPWAVLTSVGQDAPDERMIWAQMGLNRLQSALGDMLHHLRQARVKEKRDAHAGSAESFVAAHPR